MDYRMTEGTYGPIYHICEGIRVMINEKGRWEVVLKTKDKRKRTACGKGEEGFKKALKAAELLAAKLGLLETPSADRLFGDVAQEWLKFNRHRWSPSTLERYTGIVRDFVNPVLGKYPLHQVSRNKIRDLLSQVGKIRSHKTVELVHAVVSGIFSEAIDLGYTAANPAQGLLRKVLPPKAKRRQSMPDPFSRKDLETLLATAQPLLQEPVYLVLETMAYSGMRLGEALAMHWDHLDITNCQYMVSETVRNGRFGIPKTGKRLIDLPDFLVKKLDRHLLKLRKQALADGTEVGYLFPGISQRTVQVAMKRACMAAKLRFRSPHDLRHTYATLLLMDHYSPVYVQKQLGHHSITMTVDIYGHWIPGEGKKDLEGTLRKPALKIVPPDDPTDSKGKKS